jgi:hypothetical protein
MYEHLHDNKTLPFPDNILHEIGIDTVTPRARRLYGRLISNKIISDRDANILELYYDKQLTLKNIGEEYDVTRERIRQRMEIAICKLKKCYSYLASDRYDKFFEFSFYGNPHVVVNVITIARSKRAATNWMKSNDSTSVYYDLDMTVIVKNITETEYLEKLKYKLDNPRK